MFIIHTKDIQKVFECSQPTASRKISLIRTAYNKKAQSPVTVKEFCDYFDLNTQDLINYLSPAR